MAKIEVIPCTTPIGVNGQIHAAKPGGAGGDAGGDSGPGIVKPKGFDSKGSFFNRGANVDGVPENIQKMAREAGIEHVRRIIGTSSLSRRLRPFVRYPVRLTRPQICPGEEDLWYDAGTETTVELWQNKLRMNDPQDATIVINHDPVEGRDFEFIDRGGNNTDSQRGNASFSE